MAESIALSSVRDDSFELLMRFVVSLEKGIHSNPFSNRVKRQTAEVDRFIEAAARKEVQQLLTTFANDLLKAIQQCVTMSFASESHCRELSSMAFSKHSFTSDKTNDDITNLTAASNVPMTPYTITMNKSVLLGFERKAISTKLTQCVIVRRFCIIIAANEGD